MKITSVECYKGAFITVKVNTDEGISGFGEAGLSYGSCQDAAWETVRILPKWSLAWTPLTRKKFMNISTAIRSGA